MNVMITGASGGLGRAMANECGRRGYNLFLTDIDERGLVALRRGLERQFGVCVAARACDLTSAQSVDALLEAIDAHGVRFDMLLNIAGVDYEGGFLEHEREQIAGIAALNNVATLRITHAILSRRRPRRRFTLVLVSSLASMFPMPLKATYAASKRFLLDLAVSLRQELKTENANVLALCPGGLVTTREAMQGIAAQGVWGNLTTNRLEAVARNTIGRALGGRGVYVPGALNRALCLLGRAVPRAWVAALIYRRWARTRKCWRNANYQAG